jgi:uncharacterized protein YjbJ (UPF0337 family)
MQEDTNRYQQRRKSAARDQAEGNMTETKGRLKESWGVLTGNERLRTEGKSDKMAGARQRKKGQWKERIKTWIDRL